MVLPERHSPASDELLWDASDDHCDDSFLQSDAAVDAVFGLHEVAPGVAEGPCPETHLAANNLSARERLAVALTMGNTSMRLGDLRAAAGVNADSWATVLGLEYCVLLLCTRKVSRM